MNKKFFWTMVLLILLVTGVVIFSLWPKEELSEIPEIKIVNGTPTFLFIAAKKGFFEEEGLQVKWENMSPEDSVSALLEGEVDYTTFYGGLFSKPFIEASLRNAPIKTIMLTARNPAYLLVAQPRLELKDLKTIGIHARYNTQHYIALKFIEINGLKSEVIDPKAQNVPWLWKELRNLLLRGEVDTIMSSPFPALTDPQTQGFPILDTITYMAPSGLSVRNDKIEKEPEEVRKVVRALEKTAEFILTEPEETKQLILKFWELAIEKTEEDLAMTENFAMAIELYYPLIKTAVDRKNIPADEGAELLIKLVEAGKFETLREVEEQVVTPGELQKVFDFRFVK